MKDADGALFTLFEIHGYPPQRNKAGKDKLAVVGTPFISQEKCFVDWKTCLRSFADINNDPTLAYDL